MPEGPSLVILKEAVDHFQGKMILNASGNSKIDKSVLIGRKILGFKTWGKHFIIITKPLKLRIHFLMFGSYSINEQTKPDKSLRLALQFKNGAIFFYTCAIKVLEEEDYGQYDWAADVMSDKWDPKAARKKLKLIPETMSCDALLDQNIFAGVGNIIKNEVFYRIKVHPENLVKDIPSQKISELITEARKYSFDFLEWKKQFVLKKHWLAHTKKICRRCDIPFIKNYSGKTKRRTFFCENCQIKYKEGKPIAPTRILTQKKIKHKEDAIKIPADNKKSIKPNFH